jgi:hypothetical protein
LVPRAATKLPATHGAVVDSQYMDVLFSQSLGGEKEYINNDGDVVKTEKVDRNHMLWLKEEAYDAYGKETWYGGWEPGALVPELPVEGETTDVDNCQYPNCI